MVLFLKAVSSIPSRAAKTSLMLSTTAQSVGSENFRSADSNSSLDAVRNMNTNGTTNTTRATRMATTSSETLLEGFRPHDSTSFELKYRNSGKTIRDTMTKRTTLPAVAKP